ncbi:hypothetical protein ACFXDH_51095 [Streptomyces sp. NPDC059467]|uniref:hypothetical protein n=1 Tax=Streptomyces sp. NPDC059467 TaxID=3346844 RepID=UPI0036A83C73
MPGSEPDDDPAVTYPENPRIHPRRGGGRLFRLLRLNRPDRPGGILQRHRGGRHLAHPSEHDRGWQESAWAGSGNGCTARVDKPAWQQDTDWPGRTIADVSAVTDPDTGLAVYVTSVPWGNGDWTVVGGTSASAPLLAGGIALAGDPATFPDASRLYSAGAAGHNDVADGSTSICDGDYLCTAVPGYDAPTGNGTPNGLSAF